MPEIERTFLVESLPDDLGDGTEIAQAYLARDEPVEVRVRRTPDRCEITVKAGAGLERSEVEVELATEQFEELWALTSRRITKTRYRVPVGSSLVAEVDRFSGPLDGLVLVEVEFDDPDAADRFEAPAWFGREVTDDPRWSNAALAEDGRPDEAG